MIDILGGGQCIGANAAFEQGAFNGLVVGDRFTGELESLTHTAAKETSFTLVQGPSAAVVAVLPGTGHEELGFAAALGDDRQGKLALWQVITRAIDQGSRLCAVRLATTHACCDLLGLDAFNEDHLYANQVLGLRQSLVRNLPESQGWRCR